MQIAVVGAGFSPGKADQLRRADGDVQAHRQHRRSSAKSSSAACSANGYPRDFAEALLQADRGLRRIWLSRKPRGLVRAAGLCLVLAQVPLSRCVRLRAAQQPADGVLCPGADRARRHRAWRRGAAGRHQPLRLLARARRRARRRASGCGSGTPKWRDDILLRQGDPAGLCADQRASSEEHANLHRGAARPRATTRCAISGCAPGSPRRRCKSWPRPMPSIRSGSTGAMRCGRSRG